MKKRKYKDTHRQRMYDHYRAANLDIARNIQASDRRLYWFGRYGISSVKTKIGPDQYGYPIWAAGFDNFKEHGAPDFEIHSAAGPTIREIAKAAA